MASDPPAVVNYDSFDITDYKPDEREIQFEEWSLSDGFKALEEGWCIDRTYSRVAYYDDIWPNEAQVLLFIAAKAEQGSELHKRAYHLLTRKIPTGNEEDTTT